MTLLTLSREELLTRIAPLLVRPMAAIKREAVESAMILCNGNIYEAARRLEMSHTHIRRLIARWRKEDGECQS